MSCLCLACASPKMCVCLKLSFSISATLALVCLNVLNNHKLHKNISVLVLAPSFRNPNFLDHPKMHTALSRRRQYPYNILFFTEICQNLTWIERIKYVKGSVIGIYSCNTCSMILLKKEKLILLSTCVPMCVLYYWVIIKGHKFIITLMLW